MEYSAHLTSALASGEAKLKLGEDALDIATPLAAAKLPYADIAGLAMEDYCVVLRSARDGDFRLERMGSWCEPFYAAALEAYNKQVLKALFVAGRPILETQGSYRYSEGGESAAGAAPMQVYDNCICLLPPNLGARRVPLCFAAALEKGPYSLGLKLDNGDSYSFEKLGYDLAPFAAAIETQMRKQREKALAAISEMDPGLSASQAAALARLMPEGAAAPLGKIAAAAPSFVGALEAALAASRAAESYQIFKQLCDPAQIWVGFKKNDFREQAEKTALPGAAGGAQAGGLAGVQGLLSGGLAEGLTGGLAAALGGGKPGGAQAEEPPMLWMIAPAPGGRACAVEFAGAEGAAAATFVYRFAGSYENFARQLNRALEATAFRREGIRLSDAELAQPQNAIYRMAAERTRAMRLIRGAFAGRAIHSGADSWRKSLVSLWGA